MAAYLKELQDEQSRSFSADSPEPSSSTQLEHAPVKGSATDAAHNTVAFLNEQASGEVLSGDNRQWWDNSMDSERARMERLFPLKRATPGRYSPTKQQSTPQAHPHTRPTHANTTKQQSTPQAHPHTR